MSVNKFQLFKKICLVICNQRWPKLFWDRPRRIWSDLEHSDAIEQDLALLDLTKDEFADLQRKDEETFFDGKEELEDAEKSEAEEKEDSFKERQESEDKLTDQEIEVILKNIKTFSCNFWNFKEYFLVSFT